ncbi:hypothetical protein EVAR_22158_1 [Eumeta japonica]|uniref:Uncharacterized protein n=1 Tax=Eumeta variegata TaxID=151549 RepID=A0A4C1W267_EUMVA|nr:hypothetical protein EVAR_22158_1 [Eumeta japonica]
MVLSENCEPSANPHESHTSNFDRGLKLSRPTAAWRQWGEAVRQRQRSVVASRRAGLCMSRRANIARIPLVARSARPPAAAVLQATLIQALAFVMIAARIARRLAAA